MKPFFAMTAVAFFSNFAAAADFGKCAAEDKISGEKIEILLPEKSGSYNEFSKNFYFEAWVQPTPSGSGLRMLRIVRQSDSVGSRIDAPAGKQILLSFDVGVSIATQATFSCQIY